MHRLLRITLAGFLVLVLGAWGLVWLARPGDGPLAGQWLDRVGAALGLGKPSVPSSGGVVPAGVTLGGPFHLVDTHGAPFTEANLRGRWTLLYFGYTFCPDLCPTELQIIATALGKLGPEAQKITPIFVTVDPERDTPEVLAGYVKLFDPRLIGLTGTPAEIAEVAKAYRVYYAKVPGKDPKHYLMDHSSLIYLLDKNGKLAALFGPGTNADELAAGIRKQIAEQQ
ncbi:MAG: SCO family protein [Acidobacteriia bacterium]|nr:SCO family protein [Methyloceanibacter sp.]MCL6492872.1 SCO family protein [Terriglobia bacterium]